MSLPDPEWPDPLADGLAPGEDLLGPDDEDSPAGASEAGWLDEILVPLARDPGECWMALEALAPVEPAVRRAIIGELSDRRAEPGVGTLLRLLSAAPDPTLRAAARLALAEPAAVSIASTEPHAGAPADPVPLGAIRSSTGWPAVLDPGETRASTLERQGIRLVRSLVTPSDGRGRGFVVVSISQAGQRRTAAFWCDVIQGILDVVGEVEPDSIEAGRLVEDFVHQAGADAVADAPELALGLLGGCSSLSGPGMPGAVRDWLDGTLGPGFQAPALPGILPGCETLSIPDAELPRWADQVLDACPGWEDDSALTWELAREIQLREGRSAAEPGRDAGAYRYLFEHLLIHHLERYRRMLMWMAWLWQSSGKTELARSAFGLACQLADEQYAVPSHPFTTALTTRSLQAALARLRAGEDPRPGPRHPRSP